MVKFRTKKTTVNYLDDYLFASLLKVWCDWQVRCFLQVCNEIKFPVSLEKTEWGTTRLVFLGMLLDTDNQLICFPHDKVQRTLELIKPYVKRGVRKCTLHTLQRLCGVSQFLVQSNCTRQGIPD